MAQELLARYAAEREPQNCNSPAPVALDGLREKIAEVMTVADRILALIKESAE